MAVKLFLVFLKIGAFTLGGGYAMLPLIERELVENQKMLSNCELCRSPETVYHSIPLSVIWATSHILASNCFGESRIL